MRVLKLFAIGASALAGGLLLTACGGSSGGSDDSSTVSFSVTDAPVDNVANVWVTFARVDIKPSDGEPVTLELDEPRQIDLLTLQGGNAAPLIEDVEVEPGEYEWVRLFINGGCVSSADCVDDEGSTDSFVVQNGGGEIELFIPGQQTPSQNPDSRFLHLASPFIIPAGENADFTIDVELRKALTDPVGQDHYFLRPALRLVNNVEAGTITGSVDSSLLTRDKCTDSSGESGSAVYLYDVADAEPGDIWEDENGDSLRPEEDTEEDPLATVDVQFDDGAGEYRYTIAFVEARETPYTVAFTCQAGNDDAAVDNPIELDPEAADPVDPVSFEQPQNVTVQAGQESVVDFTAAP